MISQIAAGPTWTPTFAPPPAPVGNLSTATITDSFQAGSTQVVDRAQSLKDMAGAPQDKRQAIQLAGVGVMMTSIMVGASMGSPYGPAVMIGGMFAGLAIMSLGN